MKLKLNKICGASSSNDCLRLYTDALPLQKQDISSLLSTIVLTIWDYITVHSTENLGNVLRMLRPAHDSHVFASPSNVSGGHSSGVGDEEGDRDGLASGESEGLVDGAADGADDEGPDDGADVVGLGTGAALGTTVG